MGVVYRAHDTLLERIVALKVISASIEENPQLRDRFFREARAAGQLSHPHIITIHDLGEHEGQPYLAMEFLTGQDLQRLLTAHAPMSLSRKLEIAAAICDGLAYAHRRGVVHRDIKPANVFVTDDGGVKILDFGLARMVSSELTGSNMMLGTLNYMSPEQVRGERTDHRSDIFSFGVVLYELLGGRKAFEGDSFATTIYKILQEVPEPLRNLDATLPQDVINIVDRALAKPREERYQDLDDVARDLAAFRNGLTPHTPVSAIRGTHRPPSDPPLATRTPLPTSSPRSSTPPLSDPSAPTMLAEAWRESHPPSAPQRRGSTPLVAGAIVAVVGLAAAGWWATHRDEKAAPVTSVGGSGTSAQTAAPAPDPSRPVTPAPPPPQASASTPVAESNVEDARSRVARSKEAAREAGPAAVNSPVFGAASAAEREGTRLLQARRYSEAAVKFYEASGLYQSAELTARTALATSSVRSGQGPSGRAAAQTPSTPSGRSGQPRQPEPAAPSSTAPSKPAENPLPPPPVQSAPGVLPQPTQPPPSLPPVTVQPQQSSPVKPPAPTQPDPIPADVGVRDLVRRYAQALEARSIDALKRIWPSLSGAQEEALRKEFSHARQIDVQVGNVDVSASGNTASAVFLRRYELVTVDGQRLLTNSRTIVTARRSGETWVIEQVRFEAAR